VPMSSAQALEALRTIHVVDIRVGAQIRRGVTAGNHQARQIGPLPPDMRHDTAFTGPVGRAGLDGMAAGLRASRPGMEVRINGKIKLCYSRRTPPTEGYEPTSLWPCAEITCMSAKSSPKPISGPENYVGFWVAVLSKAVAARFQKALEKHGVTIAQWVVLRALNGRECSVNELSQAISLDHASTSRLSE
jgi:hypothetical protein